MTDGRSLPPCAKYPSTPYWPWSPTLGRGDAVHDAPARFVGEEVVATEKLDGGNTLLHRGRFQSIAALREFMDVAQRQPSALGGEREGVVLRLARGFPGADFARNACKSVRVGHVQTDEHWTRNWRPCRIARSAHSSEGPASATP